MNIVTVIPARYASTRLPAKPLADICGKPMIQWVYERATRASSHGRVIVATDDDRILKAVHKFGGEAILTHTHLPSGTDRVAAVAEQVAGDLFVNVQGDEPLMNPEAIESVIQLVSSGRFSMGTIMSPLRDEADLDNPAVVKALADKAGRAIYFSRFPIPYSRGQREAVHGSYVCRRHVGLYAYTRETLFRLRDLKPSRIEQGEMLEQLRALEDGIAIGIHELDFLSVGVDTPDDLVRVRALITQELAHQNARKPIGDSE
ncbi:MAG: 3-deoxy-manno-octulosonate cytidylyltransferase [Proteobacteria bacterium]|nr:MAG: 3-deoxy-manno-octulosonate cytidylyltransferase [Pseudomonadota bacterium]